MAILRQWRAEIRRDARDAYAAYVRRTGLAAYVSTPGHLGAAIALRDIDRDRSEIMTLSLWSSMAAIEAFAGTPPDRARYYPEDDRFLLTRPDTVRHYDVFRAGVDADGQAWCADSP